ncbi:F-box protein SKIP31-like [Camellia sinensis]|uniref:F-box protein SKIP31-like n=1 Tax=Camellia sinensis TaxID=4442 RepID=UPI001035F0D4|nr:F-box protein SKIP31-like [Camellia sinensis]
MAIVTALLSGFAGVYTEAAKRSQTLLPSQVNDNRIILDKTLTDQVSIWKSSRGLTDKVVLDHDCSGETCTYYQIGDVFVCEKTGQVHVCDDTCREAVLDPTNELLVCTISGHCFDRLLSPAEMEPDTVDSVVYLVDAYNKERFAEAKKELDALYKKQQQY